MVRKALLAVLLLTIGTVTALAADVSGKWTADITTQRGTQTITLTLKADGAALTGPLTSQRGDSDIADGKIDGANVTFDQKLSFNGNDVTINYAGVVSDDGNSIKFTRTMGDRPPVTFTATRVK
jgi:hypothetical protein